MMDPQTAPREDVPELVPVFDFNINLVSLDRLLTMERMAECGSTKHLAIRDEIARRRKRVTE